MNKDLTYTQCYWHANGNLVCKKVTVPYNSNQDQTNLEFKSFGCPNSNYKPNAYRQHYNYYQQAHSNTCGPSCNCEKNELQYQWISPPRTKKQVNYLDG